MDLLLIGSCGRLQSGVKQGLQLGICQRFGGVSSCGTSLFDGFDHIAHNMLSSLKNIFSDFIIIAEKFCD